MRGNHCEEFDDLQEIVDELGLDIVSQPVRRQSHLLPDGSTVSSIVWGTATPKLVFLHGGGQNAHTWDSVALALGRPAVAIDLPGHGHSDWRADRRYWPVENAAAVAATIDRVVSAAVTLVGMSLGGLSAIHLAAERPDLIERLVLVDITPRETDATAAMTRSQRGATTLIAGPREFATFDEMESLAVAGSSRRSAASVRRGVRHNSVQLPDGRWRWRYDFRDPSTAPDAPDFTELWDDLSRLKQPVVLVRGADSSFVTSEHVAELFRRVPSVQVEVVPDAGHAVQSDQPAILSTILNGVIGGSSSRPDVSV